jgi:adenylate cyclase
MQAPAQRLSNLAPNQYPPNWRKGTLIPGAPMFSNFYDESQDDVNKRPGSSSHEDIYAGDRRPSAASATTISSSGSKSSISRGYKKQLNKIFGDDFPGLEAVSRQNSESSLPPFVLQSNGSLAPPRGRNNSATGPLTPINSYDSRASSPATRPRTTQSQDIAPWEQQPGPHDTSFPPSSQVIDKNSGGKPHHHHRLHLPGHGHRHTKSKDEDSRNAEQSSFFNLRPSISRGDSTFSFRNHNPSISSPRPSNASTLVPRPPSPTPSTQSFSMQPKRSLFDKFKRKDKPNGPDLRDLPGSSNSLGSAKFGKDARSESMFTPQKKKSFAAEPRGSVAVPVAKDTKGRLAFRARTRENIHEDIAPDQVDINAKVFSLDTDFSDLSDIIATKAKNQQPNMSTNDIFMGQALDERKKSAGPPPKAIDQGTWDAPESWAVAKVGDDNVARMREVDDEGTPAELNQGPPFCLRVFRTDSTFAVLSVPLNTTVSDIIGLIRRKSFINDEADKYMIIMRKHDCVRQLEKGERPLVIQRKLLWQAGYTDRDKIEDVGRDDNSYLVRFTFLPHGQKQNYALSFTEGFDSNLYDKEDFPVNYLDLSGLSLVSIPVPLHKRAHQIISLNLSRNMAINIPVDFIQACTNLKEILYVSNDAWKVPPSFLYAQRLASLDLSNNKLEQLQHIELTRLQGLATLKLANNMLSRLPSYFNQFKALRSLNVSSNNLREFPTEITSIPTLQEIDISFNLITHIPDICKWTQLRTFWATNNKFTGSFPESTRSLTSLREIDIRHNTFNNIDVFCSLPALENFYCGYNSISSFTGQFKSLVSLQLNNNPITRFDFTAPQPSLLSLNLSKAKLAALPDDFFSKISSLKTLNLNKNHFVSISPNIGRLTHLETFNIAQNSLNSLPPEIGYLCELKNLDLRENNLNTLPSQLWYCRRLEILNLSSNVLGAFPKPGVPLPALVDDQPLPTDATEAEMSESEMGRLGELEYRRPSQVSTSTLSNGHGSGSPGTQSRKGSLVSNLQSRKPSLMSRPSESTIATIGAIGRKDSSLSNRLITTFAGSMKELHMADNRIPDEVFEELILLSELRVLNLSYNNLYDLPPRTLRRWPQLTHLHLSGNELRSLPAEDLEDIQNLRVLHINNNKFQVLPAELSKAAKLAVMDVGSNLLKYNVSNWPYDWNWNWNVQLRYLNMSGNIRLEIKPGISRREGRGEKDLTDFSTLPRLRILGLMDVTLRSAVPDQNDDRRVRTAGSQLGYMSYGMADTLGKNEHLSTMDLVAERFRSHDDEVVIGIFDGQAQEHGGNRIAKYLYDNFKDRFMQELDKLRLPETAEDALRRTFLGLNKEIAIAVMHSREYGRDDSRHAARSVPSIPDLLESDLKSGCVGTALFIKGNDVYAANVGDATALLVDSEGRHKVITVRHDPTEPSERQRIKEAGGFVSRQGKLNEALDVSRAFGYIDHTPSLISAPFTQHLTINENHELILIATRELWLYMSKDCAVDLARSERGDASRAAQKIRDLAISYGATDKIMVMVIAVNDLQKRQRLQQRTHSMSISPAVNIEDIFPLPRRRGRDKNAIFDSKLSRLDQEVEPPIGQVSLVFTDIKNSTVLWETYPNSMRTAIQLHNQLMRRQLRIIGGYEVKTEGDAFMVSFPTVTAALLWTFSVQIQLLDVPWPSDILDSVHGQEVCDADGNVIFRGLSVRMGIHWGTPVCEADPITRRMDYFGPMVNRSSRIQSVADGGQIAVSSDFISEISRLLETNVDTDRNDSIDSEGATQNSLGSNIDPDHPYGQQIRRELRSLSSQGFEVKELGERKLKGLENPEYIYLMYPHALSSRLLVQQQHADQQPPPVAPAVPDTQVAINNSVPRHFTSGADGLDLSVDSVWDLYAVALRLEDLCSAFESPVAQGVKAPETAVLERIKQAGGEMTDRFLWNIVEHQVSRVEVSPFLSFYLTYPVFVLH